ncbi:MAG: peptidoglycan-binding protein [Actinomycetia bacterium]|nr:peptidoglycan-binding protein [Actinomycetes bacterium]
MGDRSDSSGARHELSPSALIPNAAEPRADIFAMKYRRLASIPLAASIVITTLFAGSAVASELGEPVDYDLVFPVEGKHHFSDTFWAGRSHGFHEGQDVLADKMTPVVAVADGVVRLVNWTTDDAMNPDRCCSLVIEHDDGWESWYIHLDNDTTGTDDGRGWGIKRAITPGVRVKAGQHIAWVGDSGNAENVAPQLHFELHDPSGTVVNPYKALVAAGGNDVGTGPRDPLIGGARTLRRGTAGYDVRVLQRALNDLGYSVGGVDGSFGPKTEQSVVSFQRKLGLAADGVVGRTTKTAIGGVQFTDTSGDVLSVGSRGDDVRHVQQNLNKEGFSVGSADGIFGPKTLQGVISFQKARRLWVDGLVGPNTRKALGLTRS